MEIMRNLESMLKNEHMRNLEQSFFNNIMTDNNASIYFDYEDTSRNMGDMSLLINLQLKK